MSRHGEGRVRVIVPMHTPVTPGGLLKLDRLPAAEAVIRAWADLGSHPEWHLRCRELVRDAMPLLARAVTRLMIERARELVETESAEHGRQAEALGPDVRLPGGYVPMTRELWNDLQSYRQAFGEDPIPWPGDDPDHAAGCKLPSVRSVGDDWTCPQCGRVWIVRAAWEQIA